MKNGLTRRPARWAGAILALLIVATLGGPTRTVRAAAPPGMAAVMFEVTYADNVPQQARMAFAESVNIWAPLLNSTVPIRVAVTWTPGGDCSGACTLASAGATDNIKNFANAPRQEVLYPIALANSLAGQRLNGTNADIAANFNSQANWFYGTGAPPQGQSNFKSTAVHELAHGLGFSATLDYNQAGGTGSWGFSGDPTPGIFDQFVHNGAGQRLIGAFPNMSTALAAQLTGGNIVFDGPNARAANGGNPAKLYAPNPWEVGSSISHLDQATFAGGPNALMTPKDEGTTAVVAPGPLTEAIFRDLGWPGAPGPPPPFRLTTSTTGGGTIAENGSVGPNLFSYTARPDPTTLFLGWTLDGQPAGYAPTVTLTVDREHTLAATFAPRQIFADATSAQTGATEAIAQLAARNIIKGCDQAANRFCPTDPTLRAQMAVLIVRAMGWGSDTPTKTFSDRDDVDDELWKAVGILATREVVKGYGDGTFGTTSPVLNAQVISFITRAMVNKGLWTFQPDTGTIYPNVSAASGHRQDLVTFVHYAGAVRGTTATTGSFDGWDATSSRAYFAFSLWQALQSYYGVDLAGLGGYIP